MSTNNIKVCIKNRPLIKREKDEGLSSLWTVIDEKTIKSTERDYKFTFDHIFNENQSTEDLFNTIAKPIVIGAVNGINGTIFAYGQTSSGKTYTMMGTEDAPGIVPLTINEIFKQFEMMETREFLVRIGYIEIYNEKIFDLLDQEKAELKKFCENSHGEVQITQTEIMSSSEEVILEHYNRGSAERVVGETGMNERSSRSHTIFKIIIESRETGNQDGVCQVSTLNLVDLAGSERADQTRATGDRLRESGNINKSLLALGNVIRDLSDSSENSEKIKHINYRDSKLTRILSASLGGNAMTAIICTITTAALEETHSTLIFASNAKKIKNQPKVNEVVSDRVIMNRLQKEIAKLKDALQVEKSRNTELIEKQKIKRLQDQISERENQFIHSHNITSVRRPEINRRRTWCPSSMFLNTIEEETSSQMQKNKNLLAPPPPFILQSFAFNTSPIAEEDDEFKPSEEFDFNQATTPIKGRRSTNELINMIHTPRSLINTISPDLIPSPIIGKKSPDEEVIVLKYRVKCLETELEEMRDFKLLEKETMINEEDVQMIQKKLYEAQDELNVKKDEIEGLRNELSNKNSQIEALKELETKMKLLENENKKAVKARQDSENMIASIQFENDQAKIKAKKREEELIQSLNEARDESKAEELHEKIKKLEELLHKAEQDVYNLSTQKSQSTDSETRFANLEEEHKRVIAEREKVEKEMQVQYEMKVAALQDKVNNLEEALRKSEEMHKSSTSQNSQNEELQKKISQLESDLQHTKNAHNTFEDSMKEKTKQMSSEYDKLSEQLVDSVEENESLQKQLDTCKQETNVQLQELQSKLKEAQDKLHVSEESAQILKDKLKNIHEILSNNDHSMYDQESESGVLEEDDIGKIIVKLLHTASKTESLEVEKLQLLNEIDEIRDAAKQLSEQLLVNQTLSETEQNLREKIDTLEEENIDAKIKIETHLNTIEDYENQIKTLKTALEVTNKNESEFNEKLNECNEKIQQYENTIKKLSSEIKDVEEKDLKIRQLENDLEIAQKKLTEIEIDSSKKATEIESLTLELNEMKTTSTNTQEKFDEMIKNQNLLNEEIERLKNDLEAKSSNDSSQEELLEKIRNYESDIQRLNKELEAQRAAEQELKISLAEKLDECAKNSLEIARINEQVESLKNELQSSQINNSSQDELLEKIKNYESDVQRLTEEIENQRNTEVQLRASLQEKTEECANFILKSTQMDKEIDSLRTELQNVQKELRDNEISLIEHTQTIEAMKIEIDHLKTDIPVAFNGVLTIQEAYEQVVAEKQTLTTQVEEITNERNNLKDKLAESEEMLKKSLENTKYDEEIAKLQEKLLSAEDTIRTKNEEIVQLNSNIQKLQAELTDMMNNHLQQVNSLLAELETFKSNAGKELETLEERLMKRDDEEQHEMRNKLEAANDEILQLKKRVNELETQCEENIAYNKELNDKFLENEIQLAEFRKNNEHVRKLEMDLQGLRFQLIEKEEDVNGLERELRDIKAQLKEHQENATKESEKLNTEIEKIKKDLEESEKVQNSLKEEIHQLKQQIETLRELEDTLQKLEEQMKLKNEELAQLQRDLTKANAEAINRESQNFIKVEQMKQLETNVKDLTSQLKKRTAEHDDLKSLYRRRSSENSKNVRDLEDRNVQLMQQIGGLEASKLVIENQLQKLKNEHTNILVQNEALQKKINEVSADNDMKYAILDEKYSQLRETNTQTEKDMENMRLMMEQLRRENAQLNESVTQQISENFIHNKTIADLRARCESLEMELEDNHKKKAPSPNRRSDEGEILAKKHLQAEENFGTPVRTQKSNISRKVRRQSVYDENRRLSTWELTQTQETQTDDVDEICACSELKEKIKKLQTEIRIRDCKIATAERLAKSNSLKADIQELRLSLDKEQRLHAKTKQMLDGAITTIKGLEKQNRELSANQKSSNGAITRSVQTEENIDAIKTELQKVSNENNVLEKKVAELRRQLNQLNDEKENVKVNGQNVKQENNTQTSLSMSSLSNQNGDVEDFQTLQKNHNTLMKKYDMARRLCNLRLDDLNAKDQEIAELKEQLVAIAGGLELVQKKYERAKEICETRMQKITALRVKNEELEKRLGENFEDPKEE